MTAVTASRNLKSFLSGKYFHDCDVFAHRAAHISKSQHLRPEIRVAEDINAIKV